MGNNGTLTNVAVADLMKRVSVLESQFRDLVNKGNKGALSTDVAVSFSDLAAKLPQIMASPSETASTPLLIKAAESLKIPATGVCVKVPSNPNALEDAPLLITIKDGVVEVHSPMESP